MARLIKYLILFVTSVLYNYFLICQFQINRFNEIKESGLYNKKISFLYDKFRNKDQITDREVNIYRSFFLLLTDALNYYNDKHEKYSYYKHFYDLLRIVSLALQRISSNDFPNCLKCLVEQVCFDFDASIKIGEIDWAFLFKFIYKDNKYLASNSDINLDHLSYNFNSDNEINIFDRELKIDFDTFNSICLNFCLTIKNEKLKNFLINDYSLFFLKNLDLFSRLGKALSKEDAIRTYNLNLYGFRFSPWREEIKARNHRICSSPF